MNLVASALRRPITVIVLIIAIVLAGIFAATRMSRDVFPNLGVPVLYVAQPYGGMDPAQMEGFIVNYYEYHFLYITGIEHVESKSIQGVGLIKLQFRPGTDMAAAMAETVSYVNRARAFMPTGTVPPFVMRFDAGSVPVGDLVFTDTTGKLGLKELQDAALFRVRPLFATLEGVSAPPPFGGSPRSITINADPDKLRAYGMSPDEVVQAVAKGNVISPSGNIRLGETMPMVPINSVVKEVGRLGDIPIRSDGTRTVFVRDIGTVADSSDVAYGYALVNGQRTVYIPVTKRADASTLSVVNLVKRNLVTFQAVLPPGVKVSYAFDQSPFVTRAIASLVEEGLLGAVLTGLMILLFLRDWRSALVVVLNIPLAITAALVAMWMSGLTVNLMTLGGLALAVGILVDEATVVIENIHSHLAREGDLFRAVHDGTVQTRTPNLLSMLCILSVFVSTFFMQGAAHNLFVPLALAVGFAMIASYVLSSTLVPILVIWLLRGRPLPHAPTTTAFEQCRDRYRHLVQRITERRALVVPAYLVLAALVVVLGGSVLGRAIFPNVDAGQFTVRLRAAPGTRIEQTEKLAKQALGIIQEEAGVDNLASSIGFVGVQSPAYPINTIYLWTSGSEEAVLQVQLGDHVHASVDAIEERLRQRFAKELPQVRTSFQPSDIISQVMSFGAATPVEVAINGPDFAKTRPFADKVYAALTKVPALRDLQYGQELDYPAVKVDVNRQLAGVLGVTAEQAANSLTEATSSSRFTVPNYWADPRNGVGYQVQVQIPPERMDSLEQLRNLPVASAHGQQVDLRSIAEITSGTALGEYDRYNMQRMLTLQANIHGDDLGDVARQISQALAHVGTPPRGVTVTLRGQVVPMEQMFNGLELGLLVAVVTVFLLLAASFQSFRLSIAVISTLPAVIAGVVLALLVTRSTLNIQSLIGAIMAIGVAVANAILLVTFAEQRRKLGATALDAAIHGAAGRLRPILMTSLAMIAGMLPMAIGFGESGAQSAPLGRAVIGGLIGATFATLLVFPGVFALLQHGRHRRSVSLIPTDHEAPVAIAP